MIYTRKTIERIKRKSKLLGLKYNYNINSLLTNHIFITAFIFIISLFIKKDLIISIVLSLLYFFLAEYVFFDYRLHKRSNKLEKEAVFYFQILALTLESGTNLKGAIELTSKQIDSEISREFQKVIDDINLGKGINEALDDLKNRIPSENVNNIILNLLESNMYGSNMIASLNNQIDYLNDKLLLQLLVVRLDGEI